MSVHINIVGIDINDIKSQLYGLINGPVLKVREPFKSEQPSATDEELRNEILSLTGLQPGKDYVLCEYDKNFNRVVLLGEQGNNKVLGGFHTLPEDMKGLPDGHQYKGMKAGDIMPDSIWTPHHHPLAWRDGGYTYCKEADAWIMIYPGSIEGKKIVSRYGVKFLNETGYDKVITMFGDYAGIMTDADFTAAAKGSNERTSMFESWSDMKDHKIHNLRDTKGRSMISNCGCFALCGFVWHMLDTGIEPPWCVLIAGGDWSGGAVCGSRCRDAAHLRSLAGANYGARGRSLDSDDPEDLK